MPDAGTGEARKNSLSVKKKKVLFVPCFQGVASGEGNPNKAVFPVRGSIFAL
jgi:hypothetical protein